MKKLTKQAKQLAGAGIITGAGTKAVSSLGGNTGLTTGFAGMYPAIGTLVGTKAVIRVTKKLERVTKKKQKLF